MWMKKVKFSIVEIRLIRSMFVIGLIQLLIVFTFLRMFNISRPIDVHNTKQSKIIVEDTYCIKAPKENWWLIVVADSRKYLFGNHSIFDAYSVKELDKVIFPGDTLSLKYYEQYNILGRVCIVVDAKTETEVYRTLDDYNRGKHGLDIFVSILFFVIELAYVGVVVIYVWLNYTTIKGVYKKSKNHLFKCNQGT